MVRQEIRHSRIAAPVGQISQRMGKSLGACPGHCEHDVERYTQRLRAMNVGEAGRIRDNDVCNEGDICDRVRQQTRISEPVQHVSDHGTLAADFTFHDCLE